MSLEEAAEEIGEKSLHDKKIWSADYKEVADVVKELADEQMLAFVFMKRAGYQYEELRIKMDNDWNAGTNTYADTRLETFQSRNNLVSTHNSKNTRSGGNGSSKSSTGLSFNQEGPQQEKKSN